MNLSQIILKTSIALTVYPELIYEKSRIQTYTQWYCMCIYVCILIRGKNTFLQWACNSTQEKIFDFHILATDHGIWKFKSEKLWGENAENCDWTTIK